MASEEALYQKRIPIFPRSVKGHYRTLKYLILFFAYAVYFLLPWLPWSRPDGPSQSILFDIVERRFYLFDLTVYAQDTFQVTYTRNEDTPIVYQLDGTVHNEFSSFLWLWLIFP